MNDSTGSPLTVYEAKPNQLLADINAFSKILDLHETLPQYIVQGKEIDLFINKLSEITACTAILEDATFSILEVHHAGNDPDQQHEMLKPFLSVQSSQAMQSQSYLKNILKNNVLIKDQYDDLTVHRLVAPVKAGNELLGFLSLIKTNAPFSGIEKGIMKYAANFIATILAYDRRIAEIELRLKGNFIEDLLQENYLDTNSIEKRARALKYDIFSPNRVLVIKIDESKYLQYQTNNEKKNLKNNILKKIHKLTSRNGQSMAVYKNDEILILVKEDNSKQNSFDIIKSFAEDVIKEISSLLKAKLYIGIGSSCTRLTDYKKSYLTAKKALEIGKYMITEGQVCSFEHFKIHALFLSSLEQEEIYSYAREQLKPLIEYDKKHNSELTKTLQEFLYLRNNIERTARSLNMSVSGIKYRLKKIEDIIGDDLKDYKVCFDLQLAFIIIQLYGQYKIF